MLTNLFIFIVVCFMFVRANTLHHKGTTEILNVFVNNLYLLKSKTQIFLWKQSPRIYNTITFKMFNGFWIYFTLKTLLIWSFYVFLFLLLEIDCLQKPQENKFSQQSLHHNESYSKSQLIHSERKAVTRINHSWWNIYIDSLTNRLLLNLNAFSFGAF